MNGYDFESFIENLFRSLGFNVEKTSYSKDQGADLIISKGSLKIAIQVKRYDKRNRVGNRAVQEIAAAINYYKADKGIVITTSEFTQSAIELANANGINGCSAKSMQSCKISPTLSLRFANLNFVITFTANFSSSFCLTRLNFIKLYIGLHNSVSIAELRMSAENM